MSENATMSTAEVVDAGPSVAARAPRAPKGSNTSFFAVLVSLIALALSGYAVYQQRYGQTSNVQGYLVLDMQRLLSAKMAQVLETPGMDAAVEANRLMADLTRVLQEYGQTGVLIMKKDAVMSVTADQEVTDAVAQKLGIDLSKNAKDAAQRLAGQALRPPAPSVAAPPSGVAPTGSAALAAPALPPGVPSAPPHAPPSATPASPAADPFAGMPAESRELFDPPRKQQP